MNDTIADGPRSLARTESTLRNALLDSRQRWRDLVTMGADLAYETDAWGRFVFVIPDPSLGWSTATLIGQPAELLLVGGTRACRQLADFGRRARAARWMVGLVSPGALIGGKSAACAAQPLPARRFLRFIGGQLVGG